MPKKIIFITSIILMFGFSQALAVDEYSVDGENYSHKFYVYNEGEKLVIDGDTTNSPFTIEKRYLAALDTAAKKWTSIIDVETASKPIVGYAIFSDDDYNASATSPHTEIEESPYQVTIVNAIINNRQIIEQEDDEDDEDNAPEDLHGMIFIGYGTNEDYPGWQEYSGLHSLLHDQPLADLHTVMLHEIMHSLGVTSNVAKNREDSDPYGYYFTESDDDSLSVFDKGNGVSVYHLSLTQVNQLFEDMGLAHVVCFMDYQAEYGYDEYQDPITDNKDCVEVTFDSDVFLYDIEEH